MVMTESTMPELGSQAPDFSLPDPLAGTTVSRADFSGQALLVMFVCNHCPSVRNIEQAIGRLSGDLAEDGPAIVAICSNDIETHPADGPEGMADQARRAGWGFPYLLDESQQVARAYGAACTPDFFLYDADHGLYYRGRFDASRPGDGSTPDGADLVAAIDALRSGEPAPSTQLPSLGCNIKWRPQA